MISIRPTYFLLVRLIGSNCTNLMVEVRLLKAPKSHEFSLLSHYKVHVGRKLEFNWGSVKMVPLYWSLISFVFTNCL